MCCQTKPTLMGQVLVVYIVSLGCTVTFVYHVDDQNTRIVGGPCPSGGS